MPPAIVTDSTITTRSSRREAKIVGVVAFMLKSGAGVGERDSGSQGEGNHQRHAHEMEMWNEWVGGWLNGWMRIPPPPRDLIMCAYFIFQVGFIYISRC